MHSFEDQQRHARLQAFLDFKVKHPRLEEMDDTLMQAIYGHRTYTCQRRRNCEPELACFDSMTQGV